MTLPNILVWAVIWLGSFCIFEGLAVWWKNCPWDTFSSFIWDAQVAWKPLTLGVLFVLAILIAHLPRFSNVSEGSDKKEGK